MTDQRNDANLERSIAALPRNSGVIFRHYHLKPAERVKRFAAVRKQTIRDGHILLLADSPRLARKWGADGVHGGDWRRHQTIGLLRSASVHNAREIQKTREKGAELFFLSPIFATRSHPGQKPLNGSQVRRLSTLCNAPIILLGGMNRHRFTRCSHWPIHGWGAIDSLSNHRKMQNNEM